MGVCIEVNTFQVKCFLEISNEKSFTNAAKKLYIAQPAISRYIAALERELGVDLFDRTNKHIELTEAGNIYYKFFSKAQLEFQIAKEKVGELNSRRNENIRLGYLAGWSISSFLANILKDTLKNFSSKFPKTSITIECLGIDDLIQGLLSKKLDVILVLDQCIAEISDFYTKKVADIQVVILYSKFHRLAGKKKITPYDFKDEIFYFVNSEKSHRQEAEIYKYCKVYGFLPKIRKVKRMESLLISVENCLGVAFLDGLCADVNNSSFKYVPIDLTAGISMAWNKINKNEAVQTFINEFILNFKVQKNRLKFCK